MEYPTLSTLKHRGCADSLLLMHSSAEREGEFSVSVTTDADTHVVSLSGELDIATADQLTEAMAGVQPAAGSRLIIDLSPFRSWTRQVCAC